MERQMKLLLRKSLTSLRLMMEVRKDLINTELDGTYPLPPQ